MEDLISKDYFEEVSEEWDNMGAGFFGNAPRERIYKEISIKPGAHISDIGSGSGYLLEGLVAHDVHLSAIDQSPGMLTRIHQKFDGKVTPILGSSESLPLESESQDIVMANMYLHHVERPALAISEMSRTLKQGGTLIFTDLDEHDYDQLITEQHDRWKGFQREDIANWMEEAGLTDVEIDCVGSDCCTSTGCGDEIKISIFVAKGIKN